MSILTIFKDLADLCYHVHGKAMLRINPETNVHTLPLNAAYLQLNSWICGATAAATVFRYLRPELDPEDIFTRINPTAAHGTPEERIADVAYDYRIRLLPMDSSSTLDAIRHHLKRGRPIIAVWEARAQDCEHYIVIYGEHQGVLYVTNTGDNWLGEYTITYNQYLKKGGYEVFAAEKG